MGKTNHTCNLDCKQRWSMFIFKSFYIRIVAYRNNHFSPIQFLYFENYTTMPMVKIYILYKNLLWFTSKNAGS